MESLSGNVLTEKGLVQNTRDVGYNSKVKLTTAKYYIPSGRCIQGVSYEDGVPMNIPDSERTPFKTRNGRKVFDGGGVKPDVLLHEPENANGVRNLLNKHYIFDFVTNYCIGIESIPPVAEFSFSDYDEFIQFLAEKEYDYETDSEKLLKKLSKEAKKESYLDAIQSQIKAIEDKISMEKKNELSKHKATIENLIEKEIASRYFYQTGRIQVGLKNDKEIKEAVAVLNDKSKYNELLEKIIGHMFQRKSGLSRVTIQAAFLFCTQFKTI